jgi:predicted metal-dependent HD superfamily phosphohydrolase
MAVGRRAADLQYVTGAETVAVAMRSQRSGGSTSRWGDKTTSIAPHFPTAHLVSSRSAKPTSRFSMTLISEKVRQELCDMYSAPDRFYHGLAHVEALLAALDKHHLRFNDPEAVEAAIWFHDCIYDTRAKDSERRSAELAVARLASTVTSARLWNIRDMIEATATHTVPASLDPPARSDLILFLDMDLSILGAEEAEFDSYERSVRKEYAWVTDEAWRKGRSDVLTRFAARPRIFFSDLYRDELEENARKNIARSLERLERGD